MLLDHKVESRPMSFYKLRSAELRSGGLLDRENRLVGGMLDHKRKKLKNIFDEISEVESRVHSFLKLRSAENFVVGGLLAVLIVR